MHYAETEAEHFAHIEQVAYVCSGISSANGAVAFGIDGVGIKLIFFIVEIDNSRMSAKIAVTGIS